MKGFGITKKRVYWAISFAAIVLAGICLNQWHEYAQSHPGIEGIRVGITRIEVEGQLARLGPAWVVYRDTNEIVARLGDKASWGLVNEVRITNLQFDDKGMLSEISTRVAYVGL